jgi:hypothetical protein
MWRDQLLPILGDREVHISRVKHVPPFERVYSKNPIYKNPIEINLHVHIIISMTIIFY